MVQSFLIALRAFVLLPVLSLLLPGILFSQQSKAVSEWLETYRPGGDFHSVKLLKKTGAQADIERVVDNSTTLELDETALDQFLNTAQQTMTFEIPNAYGPDFQLEVAKVDIFGPSFSVGTKGVNAESYLPYQPGFHYRGVVKGRPNSIAAVSIFNDEIMALIADDNGNYTLGKMEDKSGRYILYRQADLKTDIPFNCATGELDRQKSEEDAPNERNACGRSIQIYFECDYKLFQDKGSDVNAATNYVTGLFNQISTLYANERVSVSISKINVWSSPDPYTSYNGTSAILTAFRNTMGTNFDGNLAHFLSTRNLGGGVAYVGVICAKQYAFGVSGIGTSYQNVPTYSWTVEVVTHELGHNLGSEHTHSCSWPGGPIDNCFSAEGSCAPGPAPVNGGTIMSYCHLTSRGINFNNGFGPLPGDKIRAGVAAASCAGQAGQAPSALSATGITGTSANLAWAAAAGSTSYTVQYKTSNASTWMTAGTTAATTYALTGLGANTTYNWRVGSDCGGNSATSTFTTGGGPTNCAVPTGLKATALSATWATVAWASAAGASQYTVEYKMASATAWTNYGNSISTSVTIGTLQAGTAYEFRVKSNCSNFSSVATFTTNTVSNGGGACTPPSTITIRSVSTTSVSLSWSKVAGAQSYTAQLRSSTSSTWYTLGTAGPSSSSARIIGLRPGTTYYFRIKTNCSVYSVPKEFTTLNELPPLDPNSPTNPTGPVNPNKPNTGGIEQSTAFIFPNPVSDQLNLAFPGVTPENGLARITDASGHVLRETALTQDAQTGFDVRDLPAGMYFLGIYDGDKKVTMERFVVNR